MRYRCAWPTPADRLGFLLVLFAVACACRASAQDVTALTTRKIVRVDIEAPPGTPLDLARQTIRTREGDLFSAEVIDKDVAALYGLHLFHRITWRSEPVEGGVRVVFMLGPLPRVVNVTFKGDLKLEESALSQVLGAKEGEIASPFQLKTDLQALRTLYRDNGYLFAAIHRESVEKDEGVEIVYHVAAGSRLRVEAIQFEGNEAIPDADLKAVMEFAAEGGWFGRGRYDPDRFPADLLAIRELFRRKGYLDATVGHEILFDEPKERAYIIIRVWQGPLYTIDRIVIRGVQLFAPADIRKVMKLGEGTPFAQEQLDKDLEAVTDLYGRKGYIRAVVKPETVFAEDTPSLTLRLELTEGRPYYVNRVLVRGNWRTKDHVIRREISLLPGDLVNTDEVDESKRRLLNTGFFFPPEAEPGEETVKIMLLPSDEPDRADVLVEVEEGSPGSFAVSGAMDSSWGFAGGVHFRLDNFDALDLPRSWRDLSQGRCWLGGGQRLMLSLVPGTRYSDYRLSWLNPSVWDSEYSFGFDLFLQDRYYADYYDDRHTGASVTVGRRFFKDMHVSLTPRVERVDISNLENKAPGDAREVKGSHLRHSLTLGAVYDKRDSPYLTTSGYRLMTDLELVGGPLGGDVDCLKETFMARKWWTVWDQPDWGKHTVNVGGKLGFMQSTESVPIFDRFFVGGLRSIRGFRYRRVGPVDPVVRTQVGGEYELLLNAEYEAPLYKNVVRGVLFVDTGAVERSLSGIDSDSLRVSAGAGLRIRLPIPGGQRFPLAFYLATPVHRQSTDKAEAFSFTVGVFYMF